MPARDARNPLSALWALDPEIDFLNHGSFGACPRAVLEHQSEWRARLELDPVRFFSRELESELDRARAELAAFAGAEAADLVFVENATSGVNAVLASFPLRPSDEILITNHTYNACKNAALYWAERAGAAVRVAEVPFPIADEARALEAVLDAVGPKTRLAVIDHVTSPSALVLPVHELVRELARRGVEVLVDGAHALGMLPVDVAALGADYYVANLHKWCCAPKGAAILHVRRDHHARTRPLVTSHGFTSPRADRSKLRLEFDWTGTSDPSAVLTAPFALRFLAGLLPGGFDAVRRRNAELARAARRRMADALGLDAPCPESMLGSMAALILPERPASSAPPGWPFVEPLYAELYERHHIQVPVSPFPAPPAAVLRISAHLYNDLAQYERLIDALRALGTGPGRAVDGAPPPRPATPPRSVRAGSAALDIWRCRAGELAPARDDVAVEEPLEIRVAGERFLTTMRTPGSDSELVAGLLFAEGAIASRTDLSTIAPCGRPGEEGYENAVDVALTSGVASPLAARDAAGSRLVTSACGVCGRATIEDLLERIAPLEDATRFDPAWIAALPERLRAEQPNFARTGGLHAAAAAPPHAALGPVREDVGRHNAVDKVIGRLLLDGALPATGSALVVSGRTSFEIVQKALAARMAAVISVSAPSSLAIATARRFGMLLVGFTRAGGFNVYTGEERLATAYRAESAS